MFNLKFQVTGKLSFAVVEGNAVTEASTFSRGDYASTCFILVDSHIYHTNDTESHFKFDEKPWYKYYLQADMEIALLDRALSKKWKQDRWDTKQSELHASLENLSMYKVEFSDERSHLPSFGQLMWFATQYCPPHHIVSLIRGGQVLHVRNPGIDLVSVKDGVTKFPVITDDYQRAPSFFSG